MQSQQEAGPSLWAEYKWQLVTILVSLLIASLASAFLYLGTDTQSMSSAESMGALAANFLFPILAFLFLGLPAWFSSTALAYLAARLLKKRPQFSQVLCSWWMVVPVSIVFLLIVLL